MRALATLFYTPQPHIVPRQQLEAICLRVLLASAATLQLVLTASRAAPIVCQLALPLGRRTHVGEASGCT